MSAVRIRAAYKMALGTLLVWCQAAPFKMSLFAHHATVSQLSQWFQCHCEVLIFSDPMVDLLSELGAASVGILHLVDLLSSNKALR